MHSVSFDTHKFITTLISAGMPLGQAETISDVLRDSHDIGNLATKADLCGLRNELHTSIEKLELNTAANMEKLELSTDANMEKLELSTAANMERLEANMQKLELNTNARIDRLELNANARMDRLEYSTAASFERMELHLIFKLSSVLIIGIGAATAVTKWLG